MDPTLSQILWAMLLGMALGAILGVVFAAMGKKRQRERAATRAYLSSFRYVLSDDPDAAIEELTRVAGVSPEAIGTYFAMGQLLRRKGDHARAIRLHQNIILCPGLAPAVKQAAAQELALDYRRSGLFGRATELLERVIAEDPACREALRELRELSEEAGDWERAVGAEERLAALGAGDPSILAHLRAARARALLAAGDLDGASGAAAAALEARPDSADARAAHGEVLLARGDAAAAIATLTAAVDADPEALSLVFGALERAFEQRSAYAGLGVLLGERLRERPDDPFLRLALARHLRRRGLNAEATALLRRVLEDAPWLLEARRELGEILLAEGTAEELRGELAAVLSDLATPVRPFRCRRCGMEQAAYGFRCPRCLAWDTVERVPPPARERPPEAA